jgi:hypothetical protein
LYFSSVATGRSRNDALSPTRSRLRIVQRLATPSFSGSFRPPGPTRPGIPKFQNSMDTTHLAEITNDPRGISAQIRSNSFNTLK